MYYSSNNELINICSVMSRRKVQEVGSIPALSGTLSTLLREPNALQVFSIANSSQILCELRLVAQTGSAELQTGVACKQVASVPRRFLYAPDARTSSARVLLQKHLFDKREMASGNELIELALFARKFPSSVDCICHALKLL